MKLCQGENSGNKPVQRDPVADGIFFDFIWLNARFSVSASFIIQRVWQTHPDELKRGAKEISLKRANPETDQAFAQLMREHEKAVFALAYGKLRNAHDAEDVAQEVFVAAFRNAHKLQDAEKVSGWLFKVTSNRCKDHFRKMSRRQRRERIYASSAKSMEELKFDESCDNGVLRAVSSLPEKYRTTVLLRHFARLSYVEISKATGLSETTVGSRLRTAKKRLREILSRSAEGVDRQ